MKKLKLIYNPNSGDSSFGENLDEVIHAFQLGGYETHIFRTMEKGDIDQHIAEIADMKDSAGTGFFYDAVAVSGGDGTLHIVINSMQKYNLDVPLGLIPSGTANDFGSFFDIEKNNFIGAVRIITDNNIASIDLGLCNDKYFVNVCSAGLLANVSHTVDIDLKNSLGKLAYYLKGLEHMPKLTPLPVRITTSTEVIEESIYLYLILNSAGAGGFGHISPNASVQDGKFDFIAIKARPIHEIAVMLIRLFAGDLYKDSNVIHFQDSYIKIEALYDNEECKIVDLDGEIGSYMPVEVRVLPRKLRMFLPKR